MKNVGWNEIGLKMGQISSTTEDISYETELR